MEGASPITAGNIRQLHRQGIEARFIDPFSEGVPSVAEMLAAALGWATRIRDIRGSSADRRLGMFTRGGGGARRKRWRRAPASRLRLASRAGRVA